MKLVLKAEGAFRDFIENSFLSDIAKLTHYVHGLELELSEEDVASITEKSAVEVELPITPMNIVVREKVYGE